MASSDLPVQKNPSITEMLEVLKRMVPDYPSTQQQPLAVPLKGGVTNFPKTDASKMKVLSWNLKNQTMGTLNQITADTGEAQQPARSDAPASLPEKDADTFHSQFSLVGNPETISSFAALPPSYTKALTATHTQKSREISNKQVCTATRPVQQDFGYPTEHITSDSCINASHARAERPQVMAQRDLQHPTPVKLPIENQRSAAAGAAASGVSRTMVMRTRQTPSWVKSTLEIPKARSQSEALTPSQAKRPAQDIPSLSTTTDEARLGAGVNEPSYRVLGLPFSTVQKHTCQTTLAREEFLYAKPTRADAPLPLVTLRQAPKASNRNQAKVASAKQGNATDKTLHTSEQDSVPNKSEVLERFMRHYSAQEDKEGLSEHLKEQLCSTHGTTGTLDVNVCLDIIDRNDVTIVVTDTGTGKSSLLPKGLYERYPDAQIVNCQPRRTSTINLAQRVGKLMGQEELGKVVGYSVRGERAGELGKTPLMYVTNFTLFLFLLWNKPENISFTHIILDEFHERASEVELLLVLLKLVLQRFPRKFKIVLCSATAQVEEWIGFFDNMTVGEYTQAKAMFPVHKYFMEDICALVDAKCPRMEVNPSNSVHSLQLHAILAVIKKTLSFLATVLDPQHSILVFLPGRTTVETFGRWVDSELSNELDPIMWYAGVDLSCIQEAIQRQSATKKKVYLATDIAELGLTLPDAVIAIDSGMCKRPLVSENNPYSVAFPPLELLWESSLNAHQRCGRVGRVQQGFYFSMLYRGHYEKLGSSDSRIRNSVLNSLVLLSLQLSNTPSRIFNLCHEQPRTISIQHSLNTLQDDGFLIPSEHPLAPKEIVHCLKQGDKDAVISSAAWKSLFFQNQGEAKHAETARDSAHSSGEVAKFKPFTTTLNETRRQGSKKSSREQPRELVEARYQITLKGLFVSYMHTSIESASTAFYGVMFNIPMLGIIASVVESVKSPFNTPYNIYDKEEKLRACQNVSEMMRRYKGELTSDILSSVGAVLSYMDMQRSGFSEEAQEQWCIDRFLSRIRLTEIINVIKQMKEHVSVFFELPEIDDIDALLEEYDSHALLLNFICIGSHLQWAVYVTGNTKYTKKRQYTASGIFIKMFIAKNQSVPSICPWKAGSVCVPLSLRTSYETLRAEFATQVDPAIFNLATLIFAFRVIFRQPNVNAKVTEPDKDADVKARTNFFFQVTFMDVQQTFVCDKMTGQLIIQLRRMMCARLCAMHLFLEKRNDDEDLEPVRHNALQGGTDFGIPDGFIERPGCISALLQQGLSKLLKRFEHVRGNSISQSKVQDSDDAEDDAFCSVIDHPRMLPPPLVESLLVHSCNGIFPVSRSN